MAESTEYPDGGVGGNDPGVDWDSEFDLIPENAPVKFNSGEHADIPSECKIPTGNGDETVSGKYDGFRLHTYDVDKKTVPDRTKLGGQTEVSYLDKNGKRIGLTYSKVLALAGDFFCNKPPEYCISRGPNFAKQLERFNGAIQDMAKDPTGIAPAMQTYLSDEITGIEAALADVPMTAGDDPVHWTKQDKGPQTIVQNYVKEKGGVASATATAGMVGAIYSTILIYNMDHFGKDAWTVYRAGHTWALNIAKAANGDLKELQRAYMYDAFAMHYLSDQFASGHIRVPRPEFNFPGNALTALQIANWITEKIAFTEALEVSAGAWDRMTNYMHDADGSTGLRVSNKRGESWITYGDKQYFAEPNRINRLKSIECTQSSIDEVYAVWRDRKYPSYASDAAGNLENGGDTDKYAALQIAPTPMSCTIEDNHDATGNAASFWIVKKNPDKPDVRDNARFGGSIDTSKEDAAKATAFETTTNNTIQALLVPAPKPTGGQASTPAVPTPATGAFVPDYGIDSGERRIAKERKFTENGYWFARRTDPELCSLNIFQWGNPGYSDNSYLASWDASALSKSQFRKHDFTPESAAVRPVEIYSGGFIQPQEYYKKDGTVNYAVNVWGPVEVPIRFLTESFIQSRKGKTWTDDDLAKGARQLTFTLRGRKTVLNNKPEAAAATKTYRWLSWAELSTSGKTSLLKFTHSQQKAIVVEAWSMIDPFPKTPTQFTKYESLKAEPKKSLVFGGDTDKDQSNNDFDKMILVSGLSENYYQNYAHMTRFFVMPFSQGSGPSNPDIVTISWRGEDTTKAQSVISVASTGPALTTPTLKPITSQAQDVDDKATILSGFLKPFDDVKNKAMLLHARASEQGAKSGLTILTQIYYQQDGPNGTVISTKPQNFEMRMAATPNKGDNYQVLVGDTRYSGHREMVVVAGAFPEYYIQAWEMKDLKWQEASPSLKGAIGQHPDFALQSKKTPWENTWCEHRLCALIPNDLSLNGLNVLLVSRYSDPYILYGTVESKINFRIYIKAGTPIKSSLCNQTQQQTTAGQASTPATQSPQGSQWQWVIVSWSDNATSIVPSWVFIPRRKTENNPLPPIMPPTVSDQSPLGAFGSNSNLNNFAKTPPPGADTWPFDTAIVTGSSVKPGSLVSVPQPTPMVKDSENLPNTQNYGRFAASPTNLSKMIPCLAKRNQETGDWDGVSPSNPDAGRMILRQMGGDGVYHFGDLPVKFGRDWRKSVRTSYVYDIATQKPTAVMWIDWGDDRIRILNPEELLKTEVKDVTVPPPPTQASTGSSPQKQTQAPGASKVSTVPRTITPSERDKAGWSGYVDCIVDDTLSLNAHYKDMGWRLTKLGNLVGEGVEYGVMNIFSFHGMLGVRVWAPAGPGRYNQWISRGCTPYLGQTSLGTGWDSSGHWNNNASQLSWGMCEDFNDMNIWHGEIYKRRVGSWYIVENTGWATPYTQAQRPYARGYESKKPEWPHQEQMPAPA